MNTHHFIIQCEEAVGVARATCPALLPAHAASLCCCTTALLGMHKMQRCDQHHADSAGHLAKSLAKLSSAETDCCCAVLDDLAVVPFGHA
jgi:hypothetical protein